MELVSLRYFVMVARELHFRRAAEKLHMTQAPLSVAIRKLEDELGTALFERNSRSVKLTCSGEFFLREAEAVLNRASLALRRMEQLVSGTGGSLSIGYNESALNTVMPDMLCHLRHKLPDVKLELRELETSEQIKALHDGVLDIGLMRPFGFEMDGLNSRLMHREGYRLVMEEKHPLAGEGSITAEMLSGRDVILFARDVNPVLYDLLVEKLSSPGLPFPVFRQDARTKSSMLAMVRAGFGAALLPESSLNDSMHGLKACMLDVDLPVIDIMAVWHPEYITPVMGQFLSSYLQICK